MIRSPFKFLDAYTHEDRDIFFGREEESDALYELVNRNRLVLIYGTSGTGKTSLIQCGLANRFEATDWMPLFIRRGNDLNTSFLNALKELQEEATSDDPVEIIEDLFDTYLRPLYLIFDQFEEIFVLGRPEERDRFIQAIRKVYDAKLPCHILFILREEYLANLYPFEKVIPSIFNRRLRVEPMGMEQAQQVIICSCESFNVQLESPESDAGLILDKVTSGRSGVSLPYLQVYLDQFYREDYRRTYPQGHAPSSENYPPLKFSTAEIQAFSKLEDVLKVFLQEQSREIQQKLQEKHPDAPDNAVRKVLGSFATLEGTKIPQEKSALQIPPLSRQAMHVALEELEKARILREEDGTYELAHDTLAGQIQEQRSGAEVALLEAVNLVRNRTRAKVRSYLDRQELQLIGNYEKALREEEKLEADEWQFLAESRRIERQRRLRRAWSIAGVVALVLTAAVAITLIQIQRADEARENLRVSKYLLARADSSKREAQLNLLDALDQQLEVLMLQKNRDSLLVISAREAQMPDSIQVRRAKALEEKKREESRLRANRKELYEEINKTQDEKAMDLTQPTSRAE